MFTGIIQNQGIVIRQEKKGGQMRLALRLRKKEKRPLELGESIAVNGVCLTVAEAGRQSFYADCVPETLASTNLGKLKKNDTVNLERSLRKGDPFGGHFVTGHVDGVGIIRAIKKRGQNAVFEMNVPAAIMKYIFQKGSIAVDGISLTVQSRKASTFEAAIIPHTLSNTNLAGKKTGDSVNLEIDLIARYTKLLSGIAKTKTGKSRLTEKWLRQQGF